MIRGYAYLDERNEIDIATVSSTELAVKVNAIVVKSGRALVPLASWTQAEIDAAFIFATGGKGRIFPVVIAVDQARVKSEWNEIFFPQEPAK